MRRSTCSGCATTRVRLVSILAITWRSGECEQRTFAFVHAMLKPALECLRRELRFARRFESLRRSMQ